MEIIKIKLGTENNGFYQPFRPTGPQDLVDTFGRFYKDALSEIKKSKKANREHIQRNLPLFVPFFKSEELFIMGAALEDTAPNPEETFQIQLFDTEFSRASLNLFQQIRSHFLSNNR